MKKKFIYARLVGGIGNQLFIFSAALAFAKRTDRLLVIDDVAGFENDFLYQRTSQLGKFNIARSNLISQNFSLPRVSRLKWRCYKLINRLLPLKYKFFLSEDRLDFDPSVLHFKPKGNLYLDGYWQSEKYFIDSVDIVRRALSIKAPVDDYNIHMADFINNVNSVAVHVRFFDMAPDDSSANSQNNASLEYYRKALRLLKQRVDDPHFFVFSDRPDKARELIELPNDRITVVDKNDADSLAYADLWLMSQCKHFIIANSTFSWWGAWLSESSNKVVVAPGFVKRDGLSSWGFDGLLPDDWIAIS